MNDYLVIHEDETPYDEEVRWEMVPKVKDPAEAVAKSGFEVYSRFALSKDHRVIVFRLHDENETVEFRLEEGKRTWQSS